MDRLFPGNAEIQLESQEFSPGQDVFGAFAFSLHRPKECRSVRAQLRADEEYFELNFDREEERRYRQLYEYTLDLSGPGTYDRGAFRFHFQIPHRAPPTYPNYYENRSQELDTFNRVLDIMAPRQVRHRLGERKVTWTVRAWLDIPWGNDLSADQVITVLPPGVMQARNPDWVSHHGAHCREASAPPLPPAPAPRPQAAAARFCMNCGKQARKAGAKFCHACGANMS